MPPSASCSGLNAAVHMLVKRRMRRVSITCGMHGLDSIKFFNSHPRRTSTPLPLQLPRCLISRTSSARVPERAISACADYTNRLPVYPSPDGGLHWLASSHHLPPQIWLTCHRHAVSALRQPESNFLIPLITAQSVWSEGHEVGEPICTHVEALQLLLRQLDSTSPRTPARIKT